MKKVFLLSVFTLSFTLSVCAQNNGANTAVQGGNVKIKITAGNTVLTAALLDNATARAFVDKLPLTVLMSDLYSREMCYHFPDALPTDNVRTAGYEAGEIIYWPPRHSLVIMYAQNGERFSMQKIGRIDSGVEVFKSTGNVTVTFEALP
ncbi:MAG: hypothetical protein LBK66_07860 [Spirochaetaceae bacterium]|jgi:hypothetical protein|nr:hypothetical protein [Spirochaetaceae bacterium]